MLFPAHSSWMNIYVSLVLGLFSQISSTKFLSVNSTTNSFPSKNSFLCFATPAAINLPSISIFVPFGYFSAICSNHFFSSASIFLIDHPSKSCFSACKKYRPSVHNSASSWEIIARAFDPVKPDKNAVL